MKQTLMLAVLVGSALAQDSPSEPKTRFGLEIRGVGLFDAARTTGEKVPVSVRQYHPPGGSPLTFATVDIPRTNLLNGCVGLLVISADRNTEGVIGGCVNYPVFRSLLGTTQSGQSSGTNLGAARFQLQAASKAKPGVYGEFGYKWIFGTVIYDWYNLEHQFLLNNQIVVSGTLSSHKAFFGGGLRLQGEHLGARIGLGGLNEKYAGTAFAPYLAIVWRF